MIRRGELVTASDVTELFRNIIKKANSLITENFSLISSGQFYRWGICDISDSDVDGISFYSQVFNTTSEQYLDNQDQPQFGVLVNSVGEENNEKLLHYYTNAIELLQNR